MNKKTSGAPKIIGCQVSPEILAKLDEEGERLRAASPGARLSRSDVLRVVIVRGLAK
jgi:hypothetical protein